MKKLIASFLISGMILLGGYSPLIAQQADHEVRFSDHRCLPGYGLKKKKNTALFQGNKKRKKYFEGWYFKMVADEGAAILSVIPGISLSAQGDTNHAFIQIIDGITAETDYHTFPIEAFHFSEKNFVVRIGENYFSKDSLILNIHNESSAISGRIYMDSQVELIPGKAAKKKSIMGWYRFVPFMQCYHGVVSLDHNLKGSISIKGETHNFDNGVGYIEKDWGRSMPSSWVWIQSNSFESGNTSFMLSVAHIPWLGNSFTGFLGFYLHQGTIHRFGTYSGADLHMKKTEDDHLLITIFDKEYTYKLEAFRMKGGILKAPVNGSMDRRISESIDAKLSLTVLNETGTVILQDHSEISGLEMVGELSTLMGEYKRKNQFK